MARDALSDEGVSRAESHPRSSRRKALRSQFGTRMRGTGQYAEILERRFEVARRRFGLDNKPAPLEVARFRVPARPGDQMALFE